MPSDNYEGMLNPTPPNSIVDASGRPYFLWDCDMTLQQFESELSSDDALQHVSLAPLSSRWSEIERHLGDEREFWAWILDAWKVRRDNHS